MIARSLAILAVVAGVSCALATSTSPAEETESGSALTERQRALNVESFQVAWETIRDQHWDHKLGGLDWQAVQDEIRPQVEGAETQAEFSAAMNSMIQRFGQSHFAVIPKQVYDRVQGAKGNSSNDGTTGIDFRVVDSAVLVTAVDQHAPAAALGVKPGWKVVAVNGKELSSLVSDTAKAFEDNTSRELIQHAAIAARLTGKVGGSRKIEFCIGSGEKVTLDVELKPKKGTEFKLGIFPRCHVWLESRRLEGDVGYIAFNGFMDPINLMPAFEKALKSFMDCRGLIIDVRGNGGGLPIMAMGMAGWLVKEEGQYLGTMHTRSTELRIVVNPRQPTFDGPLAVLIDGLSASCSEIFAGGMRDVGRARLFGTRTAGAVLPAAFAKLPNGDFFYYPIADYFSRGGDRFEGIGVEPDVCAPHKHEALLEGCDNALQQAICWIQSQ